MDNKILALSGKKGSGKTTSANFLIGLSLLALEKINKFSMSPSGKLIVPVVGGEDAELDMAITTPRNSSPEMIEFLENEIWPYIKCYNFADPLKHMCINMFGLTWEQCYGSDEEKNTLTNLKWENMPGVICDLKEAPQTYTPKTKIYYDILKDLKYHEPGYMTAREVLQFVGTELFRKIDNDIWVKTTLNIIKKEQPKIAIIGDCRFENETIGVQNANGKVIRLTRNVYNDSHLSENALNDCKLFDGVVDNQNMTIQEQNEAVYNYIKEWGWTEEEVKVEEGVVTQV